MKLFSTRAGTLYQAESDYQCYLPKSLPIEDFRVDNSLLNEIQEATSKLSVLSFASENFEYGDILISAFAQKEAVLSSQIEGTQCTLDDVFQSKPSKNARPDLTETVNYVKAMNYGYALLEKLPISLRYLRQVHEVLLSGLRGSDKNPGQFRSSQNWVGPEDGGIAEAHYVPPAPNFLIDLMGNFEKYLVEDPSQSPLLKIAFAHYQFETIHPFLDGNGRVGRLLIPLYLVSQDLLKKPLLYISLFFKENRAEYYGLLDDVRFKGHYEEWISFFMRAVSASCVDSLSTIEETKRIHDGIDNEDIGGVSKEAKEKIVDLLFHHPYIQVADVTQVLGTSASYANRAVTAFRNAEIIKATDPNKKRDVVYRFTSFADLLEKGTDKPFLKKGK